MQNYEQIAKKVQVSGNNVTIMQPKGLVTGEAARTLVEKLVYNTQIANDHILHELEARYGAVVAQYIMEKMPKN